MNTNKPSSYKQKRVLRKKEIITSNIFNWNAFYSEKDMIFVSYIKQ